MKKLVISAVSVILCALALVFFPVRGEEKIYGGVVRLHVIAASDGEEDQSLKLAVRDGVLDALRGPLSDVRDADGAEAAITDSLDDVRRAAERTLRAAGSEDAVAVALSREEYPARYYGAFSLPGGEYASLRVTIGSGEGKNWWCIVFPSFCTACAEKAEDDFLSSGFTRDQYGVVDNGSGTKYRVRFRILEIFASLFGFEY
ncbi:MAG: stage II sporulation protein R [Clostridia bacterium]|nr:stage II sporulation protein R [Clostridia bacterium]